MKSDGVELVRRTRHFNELDDAALAGLLAACRLQTYGGGEMIIGHNDDTRDVLFLIAGTARVSLYSAGGRQVSFRTIGAGEVFGELAAIDGSPRSASVEADRGCTVLVMPRPVFVDALKAHAPFMMSIVAHLAAQVRSLTGRVFEFSTLAVRGRVHAELLRLARQHMAGDNRAVIAPAPTHAEIANRISTHREAVTRELSHLEALGLVEKAGRTLTIRDVARLSALQAGEA